jgi:hypothetical protein
MSVSPCPNRKRHRDKKSYRLTEVSLIRPERCRQTHVCSRRRGGA